MSLNRLAQAVLTVAVIAGTQSATFAQSLKNPTHPTLSEIGMSVETLVQSSQSSQSNFKNSTHPTLTEITPDVNAPGQIRRPVQSSPVRASQPQVKTSTHPTLSEVGNDNG